MAADRSVKEFLNRGEIERLGDCFRAIKFGDLVAGMVKPTVLAGVVVYADESEEVDGLVTKVYSTIGGVTGYLDIVPHGVALSAGECSVEVDATTGKSTVHTRAADTVTEITVEYNATTVAMAALNGNLF